MAKTSVFEQLYAPSADLTRLTELWPMLTVDEQRAIVEQAERLADRAERYARNCNDNREGGTPQ